MNVRTSASVNCKQVSVCESDHCPAVQCIISRATCRCANYGTRHYCLILSTGCASAVVTCLIAEVPLPAPHSKKDMMACMFVSQRHVNSL